MALLNLLMTVLFTALGVFDAGGDDGGKDGQGTPDTGTQGTGADGGDDGDGDGSDKTDWKAEAEKWKGLARKHEGNAKTNAGAAQRLRELEDADKSELQKAQDATASEKRRADEAEGKLIRLEIAAEKGLSPAQAKRLVGSTREELEADADELLEAFGGKNGDGKKDPLKRPVGAGRSGTVPDAEPEENDPTKLAAMVPRN